MSDTEFDVVIAAYLIPDLAHQDFDALVTLVADKQLTVEGVALVTNDADGNVTINETGDHLGRKGLEIGGGVGLAVGLLSPPLLASAVVGGAAGGLVGKFARHRVTAAWRQDGRRTAAGLGRHRRHLRPRQSRHRRRHARQRGPQIGRDVDGDGAKKLKAALAEAQAGMGG